MDLQWEMAMLTIRARRFIKRTGRELDINGQRVGFDKSKVECYSCHKNRHFTRECRFLRNQENKGRENNTRTITMETPTQNALIAQDGIRGYDWSYQAKVRLRDNALNEYKMNLEKARKKRDQLKQTLEKFQILSKSLNNILESQGYQSVPLPLSGNFIPRKPDLTFINEIVESEHMDVTIVISPSNVKTVENKSVSNTVESNIVRMNNSSAPIIED
ncbi:ribonuclease H-like domain-containing protein [Tanacetum coccineum]